MSPLLSNRKNTIFRGPSSPFSKFLSLTPAPPPPKSRDRSYSWSVWIPTSPKKRCMPTSPNLERSSSSWSVSFPRQVSITGPAEFYTLRNRPWTKHWVAPSTSLTVIYSVCTSSTFSSKRSLLYPPSGHRSYLSKIRAPTLYHAKKTHPA